MKQSATDKKARRRLTSYRRLNLILGGGGASVGVFLGYWYSHAAVGTVDRYVCAALGLLQLIPLAGLLFVLPDQPPRSIATRGLWMTWVLLAAAALLFGMVAVGLKYMPAF
jgi:hypothetical protein